MHKKLLLIPFLAIAYWAAAQTHMLPSRPSVLAELAPFYHGVASGDPLSDRVIIWTRVSTTVDSTVNVTWQIATDAYFANVVNQGNTTTDSSIDYTVKVDVTGLQPNTWYYYKFTTGGKSSLTGRTRTAPVGDVDSLRFAVVACSNFQSGFFNVYADIANRNDLDAVLHLGDYYYEYKARNYGFAGDTDRLHPNADHDAYTLADYRLWHSQYKLDSNLRTCHQQYPFITVWDDHETANNSWYGGSNNHNSATEGDWFTRKDAGKKAYFEWMPIREVSPNNDTIIHRAEKWGNLMNLIMVDTRLEGRDSSLGLGLPANDPILTDTNRSMLGSEQRAWLKAQLSDTSCQWKIIGNQVMVAPLVLGGTVVSGDQWDGYPAERKRIFDHIMKNHIRDVVFLTGDIHTSWGNDLPHPDSIYNPSTGAGSVGTEFVCTSVTSTSNSAIAGVTANTILNLAPHVKYVELHLRGYLLFDVNKHRVQGDWMHVNTVTSKVYTTSNDAQWMNLDGERFLRQADDQLGPRPGNPAPAPLTVGVKNVAANNVAIISCYPNPADNEVAIQYYLYQPAKVDFIITDLTGKQVYREVNQQVQPGLYVTKAYLDALPAGTYVASLISGDNVYSKKIVKGK